VDATAGPALAGAGLLAIAAVAKLADPAATVGALRSVGLPASPVAVRLGAGVELLIAAAAVVLGGSAAWSLVAASYLAFTGFVAVALSRGGTVSNCGCVGRRPTPPTVGHIVSTALFAAAAVAAAVNDAPGVTAWSWSSGSTWVVLGLAALIGWLAWLVIAELPALRVAQTARGL
jgi:uncharacterized membrane protein